MQHQPAQQKQHTEDNNKAIIDYSIAVLKEKYPSSLTIKELNTLLLAKYKHTKIQTLLKTSTILSTKLNAFYRKCQALPTEVMTAGELPERFRACPIVRDATPDGKRLVYKYTFSLDDVPKEELQALPSIPIMSPRSSPASPRQIEDDDNNAENNSTDEFKSDLVKPDVVMRHSPESPYHLRRVIKKTPHAFTTQSAKRRLSSDNGTNNASSIQAKKPRTALSLPLNETNLYYEPAMGVVAPRLEADSADWFSSVDEFDMTNEQISMEDLDSMF